MFYSNIDGIVAISITNEAGMIVYKETVEAKKGLNTFTYDYSVSNKSAEEWNKKDKKIKIKLAENKKFYLPVGKYKVTVSKDKYLSIKSFEVNAPKK